MQNNKHNKLSINDLPQKVPDFKNSELSKEKLTTKWISEWIISEKKNKNIKSGDILPPKKIIANFLGVSSGTVQNALRYLEDEGLLSSKQRIGTFIAYEKNTLKQNSKKDIAVNYLIKYVSEHKIGHIMPPVKVMSKETEIAHNTLRLAYIYLISQDILAYSKNKNGKKIIIIQKVPEDTQIAKIQKNSLQICDFVLLLYKKYLPEWRNWQTHTTQNRAGNHVGSSPTLGTKIKYISIIEKIILLCFFIFNIIKY